MNQLTQNLLSDLRYAFRQFRRSPGFTATALITLGLGIGVNTAAFTLMYGVLFRPLPVPHPEQLYRIGKGTKMCCQSNGFLSDDGNFEMFSHDLYLHLKKSAPEFEQLAAVDAVEASFSLKRAGAAAISLNGHFVSGNYFAALGVTPYLGRFLSENDDAAAAPPAIVLSYIAWKRDFAGDRSAVGSKILIQSHPFVVVGVAPAGFFGERVAEDAPAFWMPLATEPMVSGLNTQLHEAGLHWLYTVGRLRPGTSIPPLQTRMSAVLQQWLAARPEHANTEDRSKLSKQHVVIVSAASGIHQMAEQYDARLRTLMLLSTAVLLIACANIANLLLLRGIARRFSVSLCIALGASRGRIIRQMFTESLLLSLFGCLLGIGLAFLSSYAILTLTFLDSLDLPIHATPSPTVLTFALLTSLATGGLFGIAPARLSLRIQPAEVLYSHMPSTKNPSATPQRVLIILQAALSLMLLAGAMLTARSLYKIGHQDLVISRKNLYILHLDLDGAGYTPERRPALYQAIQSRFSALGGVTGVGMAQYSFLEGWNIFDCVLLPGNQPPRDMSSCYSTADGISPGYLKLMGVPMLRGREFTDLDTPSSPKVAIVNESFVRAYFPNQDPLGKRFKSYYTDVTFEIVGVCKDFKTQLPGLPMRPVTLESIHQMAGKWPMSINSIAIRFDREPEDIDGMLRHTLAKIDPNLTITDLRSMDSQISGTLIQQKLIARLAVVFGLLALTLAAVGLYGVTAYTVAQRTGEIGIRMALGSTRFGIIRLILRGVLLNTGLGLALGIPCALGAGYLIRDQLYELHWYDPASLISSVLVLSTCALAAGFIPAYRAASIQPMQALRVE